MSRWSVSDMKRKNRMGYRGRPRSEAVGREAFTKRKVLHDGCKRLLCRGGVPSRLRVYVLRSSGSAAFANDRRVPNEPVATAVFVRTIRAGDEFCQRLLCMAAQLDHNVPRRAVYRHVTGRNDRHRHDRGARYKALRTWGISFLFEDPGRNLPTRCITCSCEGPRISVAFALLCCDDDSARGKSAFRRPA